MQRPSRIRRQRSGRRGQAVTETAIVMAFLLLMVFGIVHLAMLAATKYVTDYAAFAAARTAMVRGPGFARQASEEVMHNLRWWSAPSRNLPQAPVFLTRNGRDGVEVVHRVPLGLPMFNQTPNGGLRVVGFAPFAGQPAVPEVGDNAAP